ncbi:CatA-like O-acetyltransferase [Helicobacter trogontum]|uniref:Chloramphenicol acetyltransferase CAT n=1 Tax=Helicobacter trogontum TaxID=50960 RepID=A0A4U8S9B3_9HELI|nr:chloramphenicol acetyltransferase CAT [Helicobacter trogontum]TLD82531.1 chloramphenicol acetyltransferase CAT [Helicobacter trogontum]
MKTTNFIPIDFESYKRKEHFLFFKSNTCSFSLSVELDISNILLFKKQGSSFFALMLYCISRSVNEFLEFKMDCQNGVLGYYEIIHPSYTIFHKNSETFSSLWSKYDEDFVKFNKNLQSDKTKFGENLSYEAKAINLPNLFYVSSIPWINFTDFNLQIDRSNFYAPIFTLSKIKDSNILLNINVNHAVCDGYHVSKFIETLQESINTLEFA